MLIHIVKLSSRQIPLNPALPSGVCKDLHSSASVCQFNRQNVSRVLFVCFYLILRLRVFFWVYWSFVCEVGCKGCKARMGKLVASTAGAGNSPFRGGGGGMAWHLLEALHVWCFSCLLHPQVPFLPSVRLLAPPSASLSSKSRCGDAWHEELWSG